MLINRGAALAAAIMLSGTMLQAQNSQNCGPREKVIERLSEAFGETRQTMGMGSGNTIVEQWANLETGSWSITVTIASGITCLQAAGQYFAITTGDVEPTGEPL